MNKLFKRVMSVCLALALVLCVTVPVKKADAASVGDIRNTYQIYTEAQIDEICERLYKLDGQVATAKTIGGIIATALGTYATGGNVKGGEVLGGLYTGTVSLITYDVPKEYEFYRAIRDKMQEKDYKKVKIRYTSEYSVYKMYWEKFYDWKVLEKKAVLYK